MSDVLKVNTASRQAEGFPKILCGDWEGTMTHDLSAITGWRTFCGTWTESRSGNPIQYRFEQNRDFGEVVFDLALSGFDNVGEGPIIVAVGVDFEDNGRVAEADLTLTVLGNTIPVGRDSDLYERFLEAGKLIAAELFNAAEYAKKDDPQ